MASERRSETRSAHHAGTTPDGQVPWADLEVVVPTDRDHTSVVALVECALVELTHEAVRAVFVSRQVGRSTQTQYVAADDVGEQFQKRHFDDRLGWHKTTVPRRIVRDELIIAFEHRDREPTILTNDESFAAFEPAAHSLPEISIQHVA